MNTFTPTQPAQPPHADLYAWHSQIVQCEADGQTFLADALKRNLAYTMRERGIAVVSLAGPQNAQEGIQ